MNIDNTLTHLKEWSSFELLNDPKLPNQLARVRYEPLGVILIISAWNYPAWTLFQPAVSAIAAGNSVVFKPSEVAANSSKVIRKIVESLDQNYFRVYEGGPEVSQQLLTLKFDKICFTGGSAIGKIVAEQAGKNLIPCILELGGRNPCIIDNSANLEIAAKKVTYGRFTNSGQICTGPDMIYVDARVQAEFVRRVKEEMRKFETNYTRIVNENHLKRVKSYMEGHGGELIWGEGKVNEMKCEFE